MGQQGSKKYDLSYIFSFSYGDILFLFVGRSVKPYKKIGEEAQSDHGTDDECAVGDCGENARKRKRRGRPRKQAPSEAGAGPVDAIVSVSKSNGKPKKVPSTEDDEIGMDMLYIAINIKIYKKQFFLKLH